MQSLCKLYANIAKKCDSFFADRRCEACSTRRSSLPLFPVTQPPLPFESNERRENAKHRNTITPHKMIGWWDDRMLHLGFSNHRFEGNKRSENFCLSLRVSNTRLFHWKGTPETLRSQTFAVIRDVHLCAVITICAVSWASKNKETKKLTRKHWKHPTKTTKEETTEIVRNETKKKKQNKGPKCLFVDVSTLPWSDNTPCTSATVTEPRRCASNQSLVVKHEAETKPRNGKHAVDSSKEIS